MVHSLHGWCACIFIGFDVGATGSGGHDHDGNSDVPMSDSEEDFTFDEVCYASM